MHAFWIWYDFCNESYFVENLTNICTQGDDVNPYTETVDMLEDLVIHFIGDTALRALEVGRSGRVTVEDVMYLVRRDPRKYSRVRDLLNMNEELKKARKAFDEVKYVQSV